MIVLAILGGIIGCAIALDLLLAIVMSPVFMCLVIWHARRESLSHPYLAILSPLTYLSYFLYRNLFIYNIIARTVLIASLLVPWMPVLYGALFLYYVVYVYSLTFIFPSTFWRVTAALFPGTLVVGFYLSVKRDLI